MTNHHYAAFHTWARHSIPLRYLDPLSHTVHSEQILSPSLVLLLVLLILFLYLCRPQQTTQTWPPRPRLALEGCTPIAPSSSEYLVIQLAIASLRSTHSPSIAKAVPSNPLAANMRPAVGGDALPPVRTRSRKSSVAEHSAAHVSAAHTVPTTFFLRSEEEMEQSLAESASSSSTSKQRDSTYGVQSLADALETAFGDGNDTQEDACKEGTSGLKRKDGETSPRPASKSSDKVQDMKSDCLGSRDTSPKKHHVQQTSQQTFSTPITPLNAESPVPGSVVPSTPKSVSLKSFRLSDEESGLDEAASQAIASSGEEEEEDTQIEDSGSFPQLVMPSIQMPSRRPFTAKGKNMGRLKVLIAGEAGKSPIIVNRDICAPKLDLHVLTMVPARCRQNLPHPLYRSIV